MIDKLKLLAERYNLSEIYAFGSRAYYIAMLVSGDPIDSSYTESDVDIGVQLTHGCKLSARDKIQLTIDLEDLFKVSQVDLVVISEAGPLLTLDIIRGELLYCSDLDKQAEHELYVLRRAGDLAFYEQERINQILFIEE